MVFTFFVSVSVAMSRFQLIPCRDDVAGNEGVRDALRASSRKRPSTHGINHNSSAKSAKSKTGSPASISDDAPELAHETPMISFSDVGDKVSTYVNDDFIDKVDEFVVDGTSRDEDRWASSGDGRRLHLVSYVPAFSPLVVHMSVAACMYVCYNNRQFCILYYYYYYHHRSLILLTRK